MTIKKSILISHPLIANDWDNEKNKEIDINTISSRDSIQVWWTCVKGHSYFVSPFTRIRTNGCKYCSKESAGTKNLLEKRLLSGNSKRFSDVASEEIISQWVKDLNKYEPNEVTSHSKIKITWKCDKGHIWQGTPSSRITGRGCPECYKENRTDILLKGLLKRAGQSLFEKYPYLESEWDFEKNIRNPSDLTPNSNYKVFWKCKFNHSWEATISNRTGNGSSCPECSGSGTSKIEIYILCELRKLFKTVNWRKKIDSFEVDIFMPEYSIGIEIDGEYWHRNKLEKDLKKSIYLKSKGIKLIRVRSDYLTGTDDHIILMNGSFNIDQFQNITTEIIEYLKTYINSDELINYCKNNQQLARIEYQEMIARLPAPPESESLAAVFPNVAGEWDYKKNYPLTPDLFTPKSDQKFWWSCLHNHSWQASIKNRTLRGSNCPDCSAKNQSESLKQIHINRLGSIQEKYPEILPFWDFDNNTESPDKLSANPSISFFWKCDQNHIFKRTLINMVIDQTCNKCNSILYTHPEIAKEFDQFKNNDIDILDITKGSGIRLIWKCSNGHFWKSSVVSRLHDNKKCNTCMSLGFRFPNLLNEWNYDKNSNLDPFQIHAGTKQKAWWKCELGHEWCASIGDRTGKNKSNCPSCGRKISAEKTRLAKLRKSGTFKDHFPDLAKKWNYELNENLTPSDLSSSSHILVWWTCDCGNTFKQSPNYLVTLHRRGSSYGCTKCSK